VITLKGLQLRQRVQWTQWFSGRAEADVLAVELYGLMEEEITIVEGRLNYE
jgi:hypothetical protein